jgi:hypothetical protein
MNAKLWDAVQALPRFQTETQVTLERLTHQIRFLEQQVATVTEAFQNVSILLELMMRVIADGKEAKEDGC